MTPNELTKAICEHGLKPYITFEIVRNHYECRLKPEYQNRIEWKYNSNVDHILTIAFTCKRQTVKRRLLHLKRMIDQELLKRYQIDIGYVNGQESRDDNKKENPIDLTRIIEGLKEDRHNIVDLFFEKIQTYRNENLVYNLLVDMSDPTKINFRVETNNRTGRIQIPFFKAFTLTLDGSYADYTKDKLYTIVDERITTFERAIGNPVIKKKITVTAHDTRRLVDLLSDEEAKYFLKEMAAHEAECTLDEGWLTNDHRSNTIFQSTYYKSLKTDQERQIYATAIGQQYALNLLCSPVAESLRTYDLDHLNTFFKAVELVID